MALFSLRASQVSFYLVQGSPTDVSTQQAPQWSGIKKNKLTSSLFKIFKIHINGTVSDILMNITNDLLMTHCRTDVQYYRS